MNAVLVAGTDTGVGKTVLCAAILARVPGARYWKPIATGGEGDRDLTTVATLVGAARIAAPEVYLFEPPVSPHLAARLAGVEIEPEVVQTAFRDVEAADAGLLVVEGAGGLMVPLRDDGLLLIDLLGSFAAPVLLAARSSLGTINHTLLSLEALRRRSFDVLGVVLVGPRNDENRAAIERFGGVEILGELPPIEPLDRAGLRKASAALDPLAAALARLTSESRASR